MEEQRENFIPTVRKWEMLVASKVKMSGSEKKYNKTKSEKEHNQQHFFEYIQHFLHKSRN